MRVFGKNIWQLLLQLNGWLLHVLSFIYFRFGNIAIKLRRDVTAGARPYIGEHVFIVFNAPSASLQDLSGLDGEVAMFVNRGFVHPQYKMVKPSFHAFVDTKLISGEWPVSWLDEILRINPGVRFVMPYSWRGNTIFRPYVERGVSFIWIHPRFYLQSLGVSGFCFQFAIECGVKNIYFTGFEATGIAHEIVGSASHFYGTNHENHSKSSVDYAQDLYMHSRHLLSLREFDTYAKSHGVAITNCTNGGILDMFYRSELDEVLKRLRSKGVS